MHARGRRLDTIVQRSNGTRETLIDAPFDVNDQLVYDTPVVLHTGDKLLTTCHWENDTDRPLVNGESVDWGRLLDGDELTVGRFHLHVIEV